MTTGLQCPSCGHVHALDRVAAPAGSGRFRCAGCSRLLAVPDTVDLPRPAAGGAGSDDGGPPTAAWPAPRPRRPPAGAGRSASPAPVTVPVPAASRVPRPPATAGHPQAPPLPPHGSGDPRLPAPVRMLVWLLALVVGFAASAGLLRAVGLLDVDAVLDLFAGAGLERFQLLLVLLPLWAALAAGVAHLVLEWGARRRARRWSSGWSSVGPPPPAQVRTRGRAQKQRAG